LTQTDFKIVTLSPRLSGGAAFAQSPVALATARAGRGSPQCEVGARLVDLAQREWIVGMSEHG
jgi:hypothetical protein